MTEIRAWLLEPILIKYSITFFQFFSIYWEKKIRPLYLKAFGSKNLWNPIRKKVYTLVESVVGEKKKQKSVNTN